MVYKKHFKPYVIIGGRPVVPKTVIDNCLYKANCIAGPGEQVIQCNKFRYFDSYSEIRTCY